MQHLFCRMWNQLTFLVLRISVVSNWQISIKYLISFDKSAAFIICVPIIYVKSICTRGQFWPLGIVIACVCVSVRVSVCVYQSLACPHDDSSAVHARITKFGWETQNTLVKTPIIFGGDRPWSSRSNLTWKSNFTSFWACPQDNFSLV